MGDNWRLSQTLWSKAYTAIHAGDPRAAIAAGEEGRDVADEVGDRFVSRLCRFWGLGTAHLIRGDLADAAAHFRALFAEAEADHDVLMRWASLCHLGHTLAWQGDSAGARAAATAAVDAAGEYGGVVEGLSYAPLTVALLAAGDVAAAAAAGAMAADRLSVQGRAEFGQQLHPVRPLSHWPLGEVIEARRIADEGVAVAVGGGLAMALTNRARVASAQDESEQAERDAREALAVAAATEAHLATPDALERLAGLVGSAGGHREAARLDGAADAVRQVTGIVRFKVYDDDYAISVDAIRDALGDNDFDSAWAEGGPVDLEAIAYARRGHSDRKRPTTGWGALTPTSTMSYGWSPKGWRTRTSPPGSSSRRARCRATSRTSTTSSASAHACNLCRKRQDTVRRCGQMIPISPVPESMACASDRFRRSAARRTQRTAPVPY